MAASVSFEVRAVNGRMGNVTSVQVLIMLINEKNGPCVFIFIWGGGGRISSIQSCLQGLKNLIVGFGKW